MPTIPLDSSIMVKSPLPPPSLPSTPAGDVRDEDLSYGWCKKCVRYFIIESLPSLPGWLIEKNENYNNDARKAKTCPQ